MADLTLSGGSASKPKKTHPMTSADRYELPALPDIDDQAACEKQSRLLLKIRPTLKTARTLALKAVNKQMKSIEDFAEANQQGTVDLQILRQKAAVLMARYDDIITLNLRLATLGAEAVLGDENLQDSIAAEAEARDKSEATIQKVLQEFSPVPKEHVQGIQAPVIQASKRRADDLKPVHPLKGDNTLNEYLIWKDAMKAFYYASGLAAPGTKPSERRVTLMNNIDRPFWLELKSKLTDDTVIWSDDVDEDEFGPEELTFEAILDTKFKAKNPILKLRYDFLTCVPGEREPFLRWIGRLKVAYDLGDIENMSPQDLLVIFIILHTPQPKLMEKFMNMVDPSLAEIERIANAHFGVEMIKKLNEKGAIARRTTQQASQNKKADKKDDKEDEDKKSSPGKSSIVAKMEAKGLCPSCGLEAHEGGRKSCVHKMSTCQKCGIKGHAARACQNPDKKKKEDEESSGSTSQARRIYVTSNY